MRITPKISERPLPTRNNRAPYEIPLKAWISQNCVFIPLGPSVITKVAGSLSQDKHVGYCPLRRRTLSRTGSVRVDGRPGSGRRYLRPWLRFAAAPFFG